jgi:ribosomal protein S18 acetylase RimI-like enzyme
MAQPANLTIRRGGPADVEAVAGLHADSWRRHYRGAYSDWFLNGAVEADRLEVWSKRLAEQNGSTTTLLAHDGDAFVGFVHVVFDDDPRWGSLVDNLHVVWARKRNGVGTQLLSAAGAAVLEHGGGGLYLWVLEQNTAAQAFYRARGGRCADRRLVPPPGGHADRLSGSPIGLRYVWTDPAALLV